MRFADIQEVCEAEEAHVLLASVVPTKEDRARILAAAGSDPHALVYLVRRIAAGHSAEGAVSCLRAGLPAAWADSLLQPRPLQDFMGTHALGASLRKTPLARFLVWILDGLTEALDWFTRKISR